MPPSPEAISLALLMEVPGVGPLSFRRLLTHFGSAGKVWAASRQEWCQAGATPAAWEAKEAFDYTAAAGKLRAELEETGVSLISWKDPLFPPNLLHLPAVAPGFLYYKGDLRPLQEKLTVAVVGTRRATQEGLNLAARFGLELVQAGVAVISGLARGIDGAAHRGALKAGGRGYTAAVLGGGLARIYPPEHGKLAREILQSGGALISEYRPSHPPLAPQFKARNRIIAGIAHGVLVVEAPKKSGALLTAGYGLEAGKEVFALPGSLANPNWTGSNNLLKAGAKLVTELDDILSEFQHLPFEVPSLADAFFSASERKILAAVAEKPCSLEDLPALVGLSWGEAAYTVSNLQVKKYISVNSEGRILPGPLWSRVNLGLQKGPTSL